MGTVLTFSSARRLNVSRMCPVDRAIANLACVAALALLFGSPSKLLAKEKERPLLRVHQSIFSFGWTQNRVLGVTQDGRISLKNKPSVLFSGRKTKAKLNAVELQALRNFLARATIQDLRDVYFDDGMTLDYSASMEIEMTVMEKPKRIVLPHLGFAGEHNSKIYPAPLHDLVCKIYGLEERLGIRYGHAVAVDRDGRKLDDTWCDSASLELIPKPAP
jgi:hypothetical protein